MILNLLLTLLSVITVRTQVDFDQMPRRLRTELQSGAKDVTVRLGEGPFFFSEEHVGLYDVSYPGASVRFEGHGTLMVSAGDVIAAGARVKSLDWRDGYLDESFGDFNPWSRTYSAAGPVDVVDASRKLCRIRSQELPIADKARCQSSWILLTEWFRSCVYQVDHVSDSYIYFIADNLAKVSLTGYNVNNDISYGGIGARPRFRLFNMEIPGTMHIGNGRLVLPEDMPAVRICRSNYAFAFNRCELGSVEITGIGFAGNHVNRDGSALLRFNDMGGTRISVHGCSFRAVRSHVITLNRTSGASVSDNCFEDLYSYGVYSYQEAVNTTVRDNSFVNCGLGLTNSFCIICTGDAYHISGNVLRNFGSWGIGAGGWHKAEYEKEPGGIIEKNELFYDPEYAARHAEFTLMDTGAIYLYTLNSGTQVRFNHIHDYCGMKDNRGIFCDDGARGLTIRSNVVVRIANSWCIDSRREPVSEDRNGPNNVRNTMKGNLVDGPVRFEGNDRQKDCVMGVNWKLPASMHALPSTRIRNIPSVGRFQNVESLSDRKIRRHPDYAYIEPYLK